MHRLNNYKNIIKNKKIYYSYSVIESLETGIVLFGSEVKSIKLGKVSIKDSWCQVYHNELYINNMNVNRYSNSSVFSSDPARRRKLLAHKNEILKIYGQIKRQGISLIPISIYFKNNLIKLNIGLCKGKKKYDKRADIKKRDSDREKQRIVKNFLKST